MDSFLEPIKTAKGTFEFNFLRIFTVRGVRFFITVMDENIKTHIFYMEKVNDLWTILYKEKVPDWIKETEDLYIKAILKNNG